MPNAQTSTRNKAGSWLVALVMAGAVAVGLGAAALSQNHASLLALLSPNETKVSPDNKEGCCFGQPNQVDGKETAATRSEVPSQVTALGRLEPIGEVTCLAPPAIAKTERIRSILVKAGQSVRKGDIIAVMDSQARLSATLEEAKKRVFVCQTQLNRVLAGSKQGEIGAQIATVDRVKEELAGRRKEMDSIGERLTSECRLAQSDFDRYQNLFTEGAVSAADLDTKRTRLETAQARLSESSAERRRIEQTIRSSITEAQATLQKIQEIRPVDVEVARAELESAKASVNRALIELNMATVRAPENGQILKVWAHEGEAASEKGIAELGITNSMCAVAEIFESDLKFVRKGQFAQIRGAAFQGTLNGRVAEIGWKVSKQNTFSSEPGANFDNRVIEVKVLLSPDSSHSVEGLTNLQVDVQIESSDINAGHTKPLTNKTSQNKT